MSVMQATKSSQAGERTQEIELENTVRYQYSKTWGREGRVIEIATNGDGGRARVLWSREFYTGNIPVGGEASMGYLPFSREKKLNVRTWVAMNRLSKI